MNTNLPSPGRNAGCNSGNEASRAGLPSNVSAETKASGGGGLLTPRQMQVALLTAAGRTVGEVACELGMAQSTVSVHRLAIWKRTGCPDPVALTHWAIYHGMIDAVKPIGSKLP